MLVHWNNSPRVELFIYSDTLSWFRANQSLLFLLNAACLTGEATNTNVIVFGLTRPGLEPTIHRTRGLHTNHYATDAVVLLLIKSTISSFFLQNTGWPGMFNVLSSKPVLNKVIVTTYTVETCLGRNLYLSGVYLTIVFVYLNQNSKTD